MKKHICYSLLALLLAAPAAGKPPEKPLGAAMQSYARHRYEQAAQSLYDALPAIGPKEKDRGELSLGMIFLANAELYHELFKASIQVHSDYLTKLIGLDEDGQIHYADLYLAQTLVESGELIEAIGYFKKFIGDKRTTATQKAIAQIGMGTALFLQGKQEAAQTLWSGINALDPEVQLSLAAVYSRFSIQAKNPADMCREALNQAGQRPGGLSLRMISDGIGVFGRQSILDEGIELAWRNDLRRFFNEETIDKNKVIRFYDPNLLENLASLYGAAAIYYLSDAAKATDERVKWPATYQLAVALSRFGDPQQANLTLARFISASPTPPKTKQMASIHQAVNTARLGDLADGLKRLDQIKLAKADALVSAEALFACSRYQIDYPPAVKQASIALRKSSGQSTVRLNHALGRHYLMQKDYLNAVQFLESARDKSNKNRIEFNDPMLLVDLATANYRIKRYSESLETYFEMSKQFPAIRQIQVATQGVYSMEQKSAGDAKIF